MTTQPYFKNPNNVMPEIQKRIVDIDRAVETGDFEVAHQLIHELNVDFVGALCTQKVWNPLQAAALIHQLNVKYNDVPIWGQS